MTDFTMTPGGHAGAGRLRARAQKGGSFMASMVMPNIGAFIAWGLITALFIPTGWIPSEKFAALVGPMITVMLPLLIGYTGGRIVHGQRGAVIGAVATMGVVVGSEIPMFLGRRPRSSSRSSTSAYGTGSAPASRCWWTTSAWGSSAASSRSWACWRSARSCGS
jgi:hypothetical protein